MSEIIIVTRHPGLVTYLQEEGISPEGAEVIPHAGEEEIKGKHVIGVLPLHLAALADKVTVVPLDFGDANMRGVELTVEQVREIAGPARTFRVE